jgi:homoserine dehydrogenase
VDRPDVDIVVELIGGTRVARDLVKRALSLRKPVVTANKALLATCGEELFSLAGDSGADLYFGASVGGGIPIIRSLREGLVANRIQSIRAILNGTCNYILTRMEADRMPFEAALREAKDKG